MFLKLSNINEFVQRSIYHMIFSFLISCGLIYGILFGVLFPMLHDPWLTISAVSLIADFFGIVFFCIAWFRKSVTNELFILLMAFFTISVISGSAYFIRHF